MIDILGIGVPSTGGTWRFRRLSAHLQTGELTIVVSQDRQARVSLFDALTARTIPPEGRIWVDGHPLMRDTVHVVRARIGEINLKGWLAADRSLLWNVLLVPGQRPQAFWAWLRIASPGFRESGLRALRSVGLEARAHTRVGTLDPWSRRRVLVARALARRPRSLVLPEVDEELSLADAADVLGLLRTLARCERLTVLVSATHPVLVQTFAHRVIAIGKDGVVLDAPPGGGIEESAWTSPALAKTG